MKKTIFSLIIAGLLFTLTMFVYYLPKDIIYKTTPIYSEFKLWAQVWGYIAVTILCICTLNYYKKLGERLFDYLKKD